MQVKEKIGTFNGVFGAQPKDIKEIAKFLHSLLIELNPDVYITPRDGEKSVTYGVGPKKMSDAYCYLMPQNGYLNLGFMQGAVLSDPARLLEGTGKKLRHVKVRDLNQAQSSEIKSLIIKAQDHLA